MNSFDKNIQRFFKTNFRSPEEPLGCLGIFLTLLLLILFACGAIGFIWFLSKVLS